MTLNPGVRMIGTRFSYWFADPKRGDVIVFWAPDEDRIRYAKRVIGLSGETVELRGGKPLSTNALVFQAKEIQRIPQLMAHRLGRFCASVSSELWVRNT